VTKNLVFAIPNPVLNLFQHDEKASLFNRIVFIQKWDLRRVLTATRELRGFIEFLPILQFAARGLCSLQSKLLRL
jgi:hypothetical protein